MATAAALLITVLLLAVTPAFTLRNVDRCEALFFTTSALISSAEDGSLTLRNGCRGLFDEAVEQDTLVAFVGSSLPADIDDGNTLSAFSRFDVEDSQDPVAQFAAMTKARTSQLLAPDGFGGSDGFGQAPGAQQREPSPQWCVAFVTTLAECDGAMRAGMRAIALPSDEGWGVAPEVRLHAVAQSARSLQHPPYILSVCIAA